MDDQILNNNNEEHNEKIALSEPQQQPSEDDHHQFPNPPQENGEQNNSSYLVQQHEEKNEQSNNDIEIIRDPLHEAESTVADVQQVINNLKKAVKNNQCDQQVLLTGQLSKLSNTEAGKSELPKHTKLLIQLLEEGSTDVQQSALEIINSIGTIPETKVNFRRDSGFPVLIKLFEQNFLRTLAINVIGYLITHEIENAQALLDAGGIPPLVSFLDHESSRLKFFAAACTWVLAAYQKNFPQALLDAGAIPKLLELINCEYEDIAWQATGALRNLVLINSDVHQAILDADGLAKFKNVIEPDSQASERVLGLIIQSFLFISSSSFVKNAIREEGLFPILLQRLHDGTDEIRGKILRTFLSLCTKNKENQDVFREIDGIYLLMDLLRDEKNSETVRAEAATTLWAVTINNRESIHLICSEDLFSTLHQSLVLETEKVLVGVVATISNIAASSSEYQDMLRERNIIPLILDFMRGSYPLLLESTAGAIISIIRDNDENTNQIMEWDGPLLLSRNMFSHNGGVKQNVVGALRLLLDKQFSRTMKAIKQVDGLKPLLLMMKENSRPQLQINAACCILTISERNVIAREQISELHVELGIAICLDSSVVKLKSVVCDLITVLCRFNEDFRSTLGNEDAVRKLINILSDETDPILLEKAIRALWAVCLNNVSHQQIVRAAGGIPLLLQMFMNEETRVRTKGAILKALASICSKHSKNQDLVRLYDGAIAAIVDSLSVGEDISEIGEHASLAVWCLVVGNSKMQTAIRNENGLIPLVEMINKNSDNPSVLINCMGAILALCHRCNANKVIFKDAGIVNVLKGKETHENEHLAGQAKELLALFS